MINTFSQIQNNPYNSQVNQIYTQQNYNNQNSKVMSSSMSINMMNMTGNNSSNNLASISKQGNMNLNNIPQKRLYVKLTQEEKGFFSNLYEIIHKEKNGLIDSREAATFMKKSGLEKETLKKIWLISAQKNKAYIDKDEFYVILRLIALAQNNMPLNSQAIETNTPLPPMPKINLKNNFIPNNDNIYEIPEKSKIKFKQFFDMNKEGLIDKISVSRVILMWKSTNVKEEVIKKIASLLSPLETPGFLNLREFQVGTYLISISNNYSTPNQLPEQLLNYLGRGSSSFNNNFNAKNIKIENNNIINNNYNVTKQENINYNYIINNKIQESLKKLEELNNKNEKINNQIDHTKTRLTNILQELDDLYSVHKNIKSDISKIKSELNILINDIANDKDTYQVSNKNTNINEYEKLSQKRDTLLNMMSKMSIGMLNNQIPNNNVNNNEKININSDIKRDPINNINNEQKYEKLKTEENNFEKLLEEDLFDFDYKDFDKNFLDNLKSPIQKIEFEQSIIPVIPPGQDIKDDFENPFDV